MSREPEIGNVQLYPDRPLKPSDKNGFVLKFYCPLRCQRIRRNCGTRDRREARRIQRECQERLHNGEYLATNGAITAAQSVSSRLAPEPRLSAAEEASRSWDECYDRYRQHRESRIREGSLVHSLSRLQLAARIFAGYFQDRGRAHFGIRDCCTLELLEYLQERLLAGDECRYDRRSPNTVNSTLGAVMAFIRYCHDHGWIDRVPRLDKLDVDEVMKGRPVTPAEFERMLEATPEVVGKGVADSWIFTLRVLWESGFRVGDVMDFSWDDDRHIHPAWARRAEEHPTLVVPSTQKNGEYQVIPMLPGLRDLLQGIPRHQHQGWVVNPQPVEYRIVTQQEWFRPTTTELQHLALQFSNCAIAEACCVSETTVRNWLMAAGIVRVTGSRVRSSIPAAEIENWHPQTVHAQSVWRLTKERVGRIISQIGEQAGVVVRQADERSGSRVKFASAHDLRRGCALRLIDAGVSAETLMVVMRHADFATTQKFYGAMRSAQAAAAEVQQKMSAAQTPALVGGLMGGTDPAPRLSEAEVSKLKALLASL
ncbi:MAG: tyrosine-type recombinase/integrase [Planctomycetaceae bacterium]|nr:tyrosine-type recombinase/integrase [Planctomycetaceae bacterium]